MGELVVAIKPEFLLPIDREKKPAEPQVADAGKKKGQNRHRPVFSEGIESRLCKTLLNGDDSEVKCSNEKCKFSHDFKEYLAARPADIGDTCYIYSTKGFCRFGVTCRFGKAHLDENFKNLAKNEEAAKLHNRPEVQIGHDVQFLFWKRKYDFGKSDQVLKEVQKAKSNRNGPVSDEDLVKVRPEEAKRIDFRDKLYLSPLTTVGNLPFRRICKEYGVDITCGEMACSVPLINGATQEWALTKRHPTEDLFGVQICGNKGKLVLYAAQALVENAEVDFIDLNLGCPIDLIFRQGAGSALLRRQNVLESIVQGCSTLLRQYGKVFTVKTRTGVYANKSVAHELVPRFEAWGAGLVTVHGRSREQRYTKSADYEYVERCAAAAKHTPVFGNGDVMSWEDYEEARQRAPSVAGLMIGRGALIKPWIFQEIKERRYLDPTSGERLEMVRRFVNYGLEHWGSDTKGVETTRRFLLEWLSFLYRYVPYGLLEARQKINQRPDAYKGRDELETLMASPYCEDWIKLSEMLLGRVPEGFVFLPKHKANSYQ